LYQDRYFGNTLLQYKVVDGYESAERESKGFNDFYVFTVNGRCMEKFNKKFDL